MKSGIIYSGPSLIDGAPIVAIALWSKANRKTGGMLQTYIIRADMNPLDASKTGADRAICGECPLRGHATTDPNAKQAKARKCYVFLGQGPLIVWRAFMRGIYPMADTQEARRALGNGRMVRIGTYGDPGAIPSEIWDDLLYAANGHTAYSHRIGYRPDITMQSADSLEQARDLWARGMRTFRTVDSVSDIVKGKEILCPASKEAGARVQCAACKLCGGTSVRGGKSIAIPFH